MVYSRKIGITSSEAAELWALRDGLTLCHQLQLAVVEVELDAKLIITAITNNYDCHSDVSLLIDDCRKLLRQLPQSKVMHYYREANFCVDALAKLGTSLEQDFVVYSLPSPPRAGMLFPC
jgi:ribonuclease HI